MAGATTSISCRIWEKPEETPPAPGIKEKEGKGKRLEGQGQEEVLGAAEHPGECWEPRALRTGEARESPPSNVLCSFVFV